MRLYSTEEEERIRVQRQVRAWVAEGLLDATVGARLLGDLKIELRRTNPFLRAGLALFTLLTVAASIALAASTLRLSGSTAVAILAVIAAAGCLAAAEYLVRHSRWYRHGAEEALAVAAVVLLAVSVFALTDGQPRFAPWLVAGAGSFGLYRRYGFVYAAIAALGCVAAIPFRFSLPPAAQRFLAASVLTAAGAALRAKRLEYGDDYPGDEYGYLQAAALAGIYLVLNVQLSPGWYVTAGWFYWFTYAAVWMWPAAGLFVAAREKDRVLVDVSLVLLIVTLVTNKSYLGWERHTWDPCLLGFAAVAAAIATRRWLSAGRDGRHGFTAAARLAQDRSPLSTLGTLSAALPSAAHASAGAASTPSGFDGGRSGGGGGGAAY
jgi:hypothetical protein